MLPFQRPLHPACLSSFDGPAMVTPWNFISCTSKEKKSD
jgi:hypothetical protein